MGFWPGQVWPPPAISMSTTSLPSRPPLQVLRVTVMPSQGMIRNQLLGRPDNYYASLPGRYRAINARAIDAAARTYLQGDRLTFVVVGTRKLIEPQLKGIGLPVEFASAADTDVDSAAK